jgi:hypothetical protein
VATETDQFRVKTIASVLNHKNGNHCRLMVPITRTTYLSPGGIVRSVGRTKLGYYPLPEAEGHRLRTLFAFPANVSASVLDPCAGTGTALHLLTAGANVEEHGIELDANRAEVAATSGIRMIQGNAFDVVGKTGSFSFLYLNPPYDFEIGPMSNKRMEYLFLDHTFHLLVEGGVLLMVVPEDRLASSIPLLAGNFVKLQVFSLSDPESVRFKQVALTGVRKRVRGQDYEQNRASLQRLIYRPDIPMLQGGEMVYSIPPTPSTSLVYRGLPHDAIEDLLPNSSAWKQAKALLMPREEIAGGRPITPLHAGHAGLLATAGMLNGVFGAGKDRHIARWRSLKSVTEFKVEEKNFTEIHKREQFTNEVALVYEDGRTLVLGDKKKEEKEAIDEERTPPARAA